MDALFVYERTIYFQDTDAAGVVYFANGLTFCHEAYEASLAAAGVNLRSFFRNGAIAVPITHAAIDFWQPMQCGDRIKISLSPQIVSDDTFAIDYQLYFADQTDQEDTDAKDLKFKKIGKPIATAITRHTCIDVATRRRCGLTSELLAWIKS
ncbi:MAG: thioesterase family protein [Pseudanabaenaceae cyanobacterium bins.39]|nr:thioesterase family protein [Pseudanabaenaceae cyanobacterium bins.39]